MASTVSAGTSQYRDHPVPRSYSHSDMSPKRISASPTPRLQPSVSFSQDRHPDHSASSTSSSEASNHKPSDYHSNDETSPNTQDRDREQNQEQTTPTKDPSPSSPSSSSSSSSPSPDLKQSWYRRLASNYHSISLENTGSVARDHLALERTFLAWLRTSLAFASIGVAITQLFRLNTSLAQHGREQSRNIDHLSAGTSEGAASLPLSPLMGASLTPELYQHIQTVLQQQEYPIYSYAENGASTLFDQLVRPAAFDSDSAAKLRHLGKPLGATFLGISIVILFIGLHRYFESQHWIIRGQFPASRGSVAFVGLIAVALIVASLVVVLVVAPSAYNR